MGAAHRFYPPEGMLITALEISFDVCREGYTPAQIAAQHGVYIALGAPFLRQAAGTHRLIYNRIVGIPTGLQRIYRAPNQRLNQRVGAASVRQLAYDRLHAPIAPQSAVREIDQRRARRFTLPFG